MSALEQRVRRALKRQGYALHRTRERQRETLGDYYIIDADNNTMWQYRCDLETLARELGLA